MDGRKRFLFLLIAILSANQLHALDLPPRLQEFRRFALQQMKEDQVPGMTIGYVRWGLEKDDVWTEAFGYSDLENQIPAKENSAYRLGSVSKPMTAAAVLILAEKGKIDLDAEVQTYVPYFPKKKWPVTVRQLLGHIGGISHYKNYDVEGRIKEHKSTRDAIAIFENFDLVVEPGTKYSYSSYGYNLLAAVVEGASGMAFGDFMTQSIWKPLNMNDTRLDHPADLISHRVRGYRILKGEIKNSEFVDISSRLGGGGTRSTVPDLLSFAKGLMEGKLVSSDSLELIYSSMATRDGRFTDYTAGWGIRMVNGHFVLRHTGSQPETATILMIFPALKLAIACAINQEDAGASVFAQRLIEVITDETWGIAGYVTANKNSYRAIDSVFASGMSHFELRGKPLTQDRDELKAAFDYFRSSIKDESTRTAEFVEDGRHIVSGRAYTKIGSFMARTLTDQFGAERFKGYHTAGPILFFADYLDLCKKRKNDFTCVFPERFEKLIGQWEQSWTRSHAAVQGLRIHSESNLEEVGAVLQRASRSASAYPDFSGALANLTWNFLRKGDSKKSLQAGAIGASIYPDSARLLAFYGVSLAALSDEKPALTFLKKAYQLDPESPAEPDLLTDLAEELANAGKIREATNLMKVAVELHPKEPEVLSEMGDAYSMMNETAKAREYFQRALAIDPAHEDAISGLQKIQK